MTHETEKGFGTGLRSMLERRQNGVDEDTATVAVAEETAAPAPVSAPVEVIVQAGARFALLFARNDEAPASPIIGLTPNGTVAWQLAEAYTSMEAAKDNDTALAEHAGSMHVISLTSGAILRVSHRCSATCCTTARNTRRPGVTYG